MTTLEAIVAEIERQRTPYNNTPNLWILTFDGNIDLEKLAKAVDDNISKVIKEDLKKALDAL